MIFPPDLITARLRLVAITPELMRAEVSSLPDRLQTAVPDLWPPEHWEPHVFDLLERQYLDAPHSMAWNRFIILREPEPVMIGTMGAFVRTDSEAEIGYSIMPPWQSRGLATEGLSRLLAEIFLNPSIRTITAQTFPHLTASIRVLEKCGFREVGLGDEVGTLRYRMNNQLSFQ